MQKDGEPSVEDILRSIKQVISRDDKAHGAQAGATPSFGNARPFTPRDAFARYSATPATGPDPAPEPVADPAPLATEEAADVDDVYDLGNLLSEDVPAGSETIIGLTPVSLPAAFALPGENAPQEDWSEEDAATDIGEPVAVGASEQREPDAISEPAPQEPRSAPAIRESEERLIAGATAAAMRDQLSALSSLSAAAPKIEAVSHPLEDVVRDMLRPLLKDWLDANLQGIVERIVQDEISRITGNR